MSCLRACQAALIALLLASATLAEDTAAADTRLSERVNLRTSYFAFTPPESLAAWNERREAVRRQIAVAAGHWPDLPRPEPNAVVHGAVDRDAYTVSRVYLETVPGHYATGSLFRPKLEGRHPAVISPYGHWPGGRFQDTGPEGVARQIAEGAEKFEVGGRHAIQARCVQLARMGCVVFLIDCVGYGDSQLDQASIHQPTADIVVRGQPWGFYSAQAELRFQNPLGLQLYDARCALDWLETLPDVDPDRLAVTGASGGGTQTMMLGATDDRLKVSFPAAMVSTAMQGGCPCENAVCLRLGTGNVEIAALFAPKPMGIGAANDWTREMPTKGFPELQTLYGLYGEQDHVSLTSLNQFGHNYNYPTRAAMYLWMKEWLGLDDSVDPVERDFTPLTIEELTVWTDAHPKPTSGDRHEVELLQQWTRLSDAALADARPDSPEGLAEFRRVVGGALEVMTGRAGSGAARILVEQGPISLPGRDQKRNLTVRNPDDGAVIPAVLFGQRGGDTPIVIWTHPGGRSGIDGEVLMRLVHAGYQVLTADLLNQGEHLVGGEQITELPSDVPERASAGLTYGYNRTLVAEQAADLLALVAAAEQIAPGAPVMLLAERGTAPYAATAFALAGDRLTAAAIDTGSFRFADLADWHDLRFLPGAVKYGDLPGLFALGAPTPLIVAGEESYSLPLAVWAYQSAGNESSLDYTTGDQFTAAVLRFFNDHQ
ncbi:hypothetical protein Pla123a_08300 [Posidoniimonas polymericola]|uniref:Acetyl xylan esterase (AXE1) n=1 Tax=Posidoniimonas polymericola TaxID=2528002 RepID=A0A5C5ZFB9_9BACT|nr:acetylxylan esterase [Posidoniimonas polymericola]TWT86022.1 hypothetical protein Pla123a_08300 [Posidoniimonas polymericola]